MRLQVKSIKKLPFIVSYINLHDSFWEGYTKDSCAEAVKKGFVRLYKAHGENMGRFSYEESNYVDIPLSDKMEFKPIYIETESTVIDEDIFHS